MLPFLEDLDTSYKGIVDRIMASLAESGLITDAVAGGVARTLVESFSREMATFYAILARAHAAG